MTLNLQVLRDELEYLVNVEKFPFGILMDNGNLNYLQELEIDENGRLTCYLPHVDDYYYVAKQVTSLPDNYSNWVDHLYNKDENNILTLFQRYIIDKYTRYNGRKARGRVP